MITKKVKEPEYRICPICYNKMIPSGELLLQGKHPERERTVYTYRCSLCGYRNLDTKKYKDPRKKVRK
jgi:C4-type Zn-finger protein